MRTNHPTSKRNLCLSDNSNAPHSVVHESFEADDAYELYQPENAQSLDSSHNYMPDDITRDIAKRMHYAAFRWKRSKGVAESRKWQQAYIALRDQIVLGNRKLVYQAVRRRMAMSNRADDLIGDCQIVLIQAVAAYNPWMGIRFSTYAYTCLVRALARLAQKLSNDWLSKSASLDVMPEGEPRQSKEPGASSSIAVPIDDFLQADHPLLNQREKKILSLRYCNPEGGEVITLEKVGKQLGLSKERVRQVQATALSKLRAALQVAEQV